MDDPLAIYLHDHLGRLEFRRKLLTKLSAEFCRHTHGYVVAEFAFVGANGVGTFAVSRLLKD